MSPCSKAEKFESDVSGEGHGEKCKHSGRIELICGGDLPPSFYYSMWDSSLMDGSAHI
jgi:hypothetical protein